MGTAGLARLVAGLGAAWALAFLVVGLGARLHLFADGALFAYAVAADDGWAMHWRQIPGRVAAWLFASVPGQLAVRVTGDPALGVAVYGALLFAAPGLGLMLAWRADRTGVLRLWAALSTALMCPVVFGFPTELWFAHAAAWPALALLWVPDTGARRLGGAVLLAAVVLSHEAAVGWAVLLVAGLGLSPGGWATARVGALALLPAMALWGAMKLGLPPDAYEAEVLSRNAGNLMSPDNLLSPLMLEMAGALAVYAAAARGLGVPAGAAVAGAMLMLWWALGDGPVHAWDRYFLRLVFAGLVAALGLGAVLHAGAWGRSLARRLPTAVIAGALAVATLVHAGETVRFVRAWTLYLAEVARLAGGPATDPALGDGRFVSAARVEKRLVPLAWQSTTPFLSVLLAPGLRPERLVVDPDASYFWFDCPTARANADAAGALAEGTRAMVRVYACIHR